MTRQLSVAVLIAMTCLPTGDSRSAGGEILRDPWGVPHIFAESAEAGLLRARICHRRRSASADGVGAA